LEKLYQEVVPGRPIQINIDKMSAGLTLSTVMIMATILLIAYGDDFGTSTEIVKLDFGEPGVNVQDGFHKLGLPDGSTGTFSTTFKYSGGELEIGVNGFTHSKGNYKPVTNFYSGLSNLLRSSFLRNSPGVMNVRIAGLSPFSVYSIKTYHHSTSYARGGVSFSLQYEGNPKIALKQSGNGKNPDPPLTHTERVESSKDGVVRLEMESEDGIGGVQNAHMDINGMEIKLIGRTDGLKLDFGWPAINLQKGFIKLGRRDGPGGGLYYSQFDWSGQTVGITITGWTFVGGNFKPVTNAYAGLSNMLRSSFLRGKPGKMYVEISGLKRVTMYLIKTYHHNPSYPRGGKSFSLEYEGNVKVLLKQCADGQSPDPPLVHSEVVQSSGDGIIRLVMNSGHGGGVKERSDALMDLNGMEIKYMGMGNSDKVRFDFGEPGVNVQEGYLKVGLPDGESGSYVSAFEHFGQIATITITGYTHTRGNSLGVVNSYSGLSNLLRSSFLRESRGVIRVEIFGLKPQEMYHIKTYHHDSTLPRGGVTFSVQPEGNRKVLLQQASSGTQPNVVAVYSDAVRSNRYGIVRLVMNSAEGGGNIRGDAPLNLNGMEIAHLGKDNVQLDFGWPGVYVQAGFLKVGLPDTANSNNAIFNSTFNYVGRSRGIKITGWTHVRGKYAPVTNQYNGLSNLLRSSFIRESPGEMKVEITGMPPLTRYLIKTYHHSTLYPRGGKGFSLQYDGNTKIVLKQNGFKQNPSPPLIHADVVKSSSDGTIRLVMVGNSGSSSVPANSQMNLNGMEIKHLVLSTGGRLDFGQPGKNVQDGYLKVGLPDTTYANGQSTFTTRFELFGEIVTIKISGWTHIRGNYADVRNSWSALSNLLRSGFIRNIPGKMTVQISGLKPLRMYLLKTYHHSTSWTDGGAKFVIAYEGKQSKQKQQSGNGQHPDPPTIHPELVLSNAGGKINLGLYRIPQERKTSNMNLNGMEIYLCE